MPTALKAALLEEGEFSLLITKTEEKAKAPEEGQENDEARGVDSRGESVLQGGYKFPSNSK